MAAPLYRAPSSPADAGPRGDLEARRDELTGALRELEWDRASGLLDPAEYRRQRDAYEAELAGVLRGLESAD